MPTAPATPEAPDEPAAPEIPSAPEYVPTPAKPTVPTAMKAGWLKSSDDWYYFASAGTAPPIKGWLDLYGIWRYLNPDDNGKMLTGLYRVNGVNCISDASGAIQSGGWVKLGDDWYYAEDSGAMHTGWLLDRGTWYYLQGSGAMATGWVRDGGAWYLMDGSGVMLAGLATFFDTFSETEARFPELDRTHVPWSRVQLFVVVPPNVVVELRLEVVQAAELLPVHEFGL